MKLTNPQQFEMLVAELEKNPVLAKGFRRGITPSNFKQSWEEIAKKINAVGPPSRDSDGWQNVWRDLKFKVKKKMMHNKAESTATGGGRHNQVQLCPIEEAVASLLNFDAQISPAGRFVGIAVPQTVCEEIESPAAAEPSNSCDPCVAIENTPMDIQTPCRNRKRGKENLLEKHHEMQEKFFKEMSTSLKLMQNHFKDVARYERKQYELAQRKSQRDEELFQIEMEVKKKKIEVLEKQLQG